MFANSDAHTPESVGMFHNVLFADEDMTPSTIVNGIKSGLIYASNLIYADATHPSGGQNS
jgi:hypothetical protein